MLFNALALRDTLYVFSDKTGETIRNNDEEFDPGSGWTLAAGLTHASRGVTGELASADDRRTGA